MRLTREFRSPQELRTAPTLLLVGQHNPARVYVNVAAERVRAHELHDSGRRRGRLRTQAVGRHLRGPAMSDTSTWGWKRCDSGQCVAVVRKGTRYCCSPCAIAWEASPRYEPHAHSEGCVERQEQRHELSERLAR